MTEQLETANSNIGFDALVVGASLAGCTAAMLLASHGANVLLIERRPDPNAFKVVCGHYIQSSALPTIRRIGLYEPMIAAGALHSPAIVCWEGGSIGPVPPDVVEPSINLRRRKLDPIIKGLAGATPGVDLRLGAGLVAFEAEGDRVIARLESEEGTSTVSARLLVGADGRDSTVVRLGGFRTARSKHGRFNYSPFYEGPRHADFPATTTWFMGDQWAGAFPTDDGLTGYYLMPTHDRLDEFKIDLEGACLRMVTSLPGAPPAEELKLAGPIVGRIDMTNQWRNPAHGNVALIGDAALSVDPLFGVGCGWAFQSAEMLADAVGPALAAEQPVRSGLRAYRRRFAREIIPHSLQLAPLARGRALSRMEKFAMRRAARDPGIEEQFIGLVTRNVSPLELMRPRPTLQLLRA